jgi:mannan endo-1,4-beta-mannosidase
MASSVSSEFITSNGNKFDMNGKSFYFSGTNNYYLQYSSKNTIDNVFRQAKSMHLKVMRIWGFMDGNQINNIVLQSAPGVYNESGFKNFDYIIKKAKESEIKLIIPFVNNWNDFGGMNQYVKWSGAEGHDDFYKNESCRTAYKNYINYFLNRVNTYTGVEYKNDPTIMTWELANEPRCQSDPSGDTIYNWAKEMSSYVKNIDKNHLVAVGDEGFFKMKSSDWSYNGSEGVDWDRLITIPNIDYGTVHLYPDNWGKSSDWGTQWIKDHINAANAVNKPMVLEEYAVKYNKDSVYKIWGDTLEKNGADGVMFWILRADNLDKKSDPNPDKFGVVYPSSTASVIMKTADEMNYKSGDHVNSYLANIKAFFNNKCVK